MAHGFPIRSVDQILRLPEVLRIVGLSRSTVYRLAANGDFPQPIRLGRRSTGWRLSELTEWLATRGRAREAGSR